MMGSKKKGSNMDQMKSSNSSKLINSLVLDTTVQGDVRTNNDIRIDGTLIGKLECNGKVIIGSQGKVEGEIKCHNAVIEGGFAGSIHVSELMIVEESARIEGDVFTDKLQVEPGAIYNVKCVMGGQQIQASKEKTEAV
jgi:cytoskeletal protein CcmA (bactofilin family)